MCRVILVLTVFICLASALPNRQRKASPILKVRSLKDIDPNAFIDQILDAARTVITEEGLDPVQIGKHSFGFIDTDGELSGISTIHRNGDAQVTQVGNVLDITVDLQVYNLIAAFTWEANIGDWHPHGDANASIESIDVNLQVRVDLSDPAKLNVTLEVLVIHDINNVKVAVGGLGPFDKLVDIIATGIADLVKGFLPDLIDGPIKDAVQKAIDSIIG